jgi:SAM-dependent methyltransferase
MGGMDAVEWDRRYAAQDLMWGAEPNRWVREVAGGLRPGRALDVAAGEGRNALWLAGLGWEVTAVDFSAVAVERGRRLAAAGAPAAAGRVRWVVADVRDHLVPVAELDLVLVAYLHLGAGDRRAVLRRLLEAVAPGGALLVVGHDLTNIDQGVGGPQDPDVLFTPDDVLADLAGRAFEVVRAERVRRPVARDGGTTADAIDALVHLRRPPEPAR